MLCCAWVQGCRIGRLVLDFSSNLLVGGVLRLFLLYSCASVRLVLADNSVSVCTYL